MDNKYLVINVSEFDTINSMCDTAFGYPDAFTLTYSEPILHADGERCIFIVEPRVMPLLSNELVSALLDAAPPTWEYPVLAEPVFPVVP